MQLKRRLVFMIFIWFFACFALIGPIKAAEPMVFTTTIGSEGGKLGAKVLSEAYRRLGIEILVDERPGLRAVYDANRGETSSGEVIRLKHILKKYQNLRQVPEPVIYMQQVAAATDASIKIDGWGSVKPYTVVTVIGYKSIQRRVENQPHLFVNSLSSALEILKVGRADLLLLSRLDILREIKKSKTTNVHILPQPLARVPFYHMLHKAHDDLVPKIDRVLKEMRADGMTDSIVNAHILELKN